MNRLNIRADGKELFDSGDFDAEDIRGNVENEWSEKGYGAATRVFLMKQISGLSGGYRLRCAFTIKNKVCA